MMANIARCYLPSTTPDDILIDPSIDFPLVIHGVPQSRTLDVNPPITPITFRGGILRRQYRQTAAGLLPWENARGLNQSWRVVLWWAGTLGDWGVPLGDGSM